MVKTRPAARSIEGTKLEPKSKKDLEPKKDIVRKLASNRIKLAAYARQCFHVNIESDVSLKDVLKPEYWAHISNKLQIGDKIEAIWDDASYYAELKVIDCGPQWARVRCLYNVNLEKKLASPEPDQASLYTVEYGNMHTKYVVKRNSDGERISKGHETREAAQNWLAKHIAKV